MAKGAGRLRIALHRSGRAGEQKRALDFRQHALHRLLRDQKAAEGGDGQSLLDLDRIEIEQGAAHAIARIVDDDIGRQLRGVEIVEQLGDIVSLRRVAFEGARAGGLRELPELLRRPRRECNLHAVFQHQFGERRRKTGPGADDESGGVFHGASIFVMAGLVPAIHAFILRTA